ncbi:fibrinogen-like protein A [Zeugodacus cucurbitae]|uniref:fibrinogen-like protein A n=1 Tax=Zeugodacus cucurbitae TaxID=28588 RepID=UPI0005969EB8|nr:fibrinogen-like protein A [Zeugodacus cucurbitae]
MHQFKSCAQTVNASQSIMFPNFLKILLYLILIFRIRYCLSENNEQNATDACTCDVEIDVVREFMDDLDVVQKSGTKLESKMSNIEKLLIANRVPKLPTNCMEATGNSTKNGVYHIQLQKVDIDDLKVFCVEDVDFGGWLVIQRRQSDSVDFYRNWTDYKKGFGDLTGNYWIGLEKLHALTSDCEQELYIQMRRRNGKEYYAKYTQFVIAGESENYALKKLGNYSGNAGDSFRRQLGMKFSTYDRDNDIHTRNCAEMFKGGWWFEKCYLCHLNGRYSDDEYGVNWVQIERLESLAFAQMMIRPTRNCLKQLLLRNLNASA